jgi:hypothetical protein
MIDEELKTISLGNLYFYRLWTVRTETGSTRESRDHDGMTKRHHCILWDKPGPKDILGKGRNHDQASLGIIDCTYILTEAPLMAAR